MLSLATLVANKEINNVEKCRQIAGNFDCYIDAAIQCGLWGALPD
jgi:hypothetical protein